MTPRDELRAALDELAAGPRAEQSADYAAALSDVRDALPSLPAGGGGGPSEVFLVWGVNHGDPDEHTVLGVYATRAAADDALDREDFGAEWADVRFTDYQGPDRREVLGASSSAGDEAREALERALARFDERDLHVADEDYEAVFAAARLVVSSPLPGAGDGRRGELTREEIEDHLDRARALVLRVREQPMYDDLAEALYDVDDALSVALNELWDSDDEPAPADEETTR